MNWGMSASSISVLGSGEVEALDCIVLHRPDLLSIEMAFIPRKVIHLLKKRKKRLCLRGILQALVRLLMQYPVLPNPGCARNNGSC